METDLIIIGAGPAGYVAAIRAGQTGLKTVLIEKERTGGMCLNWGCIPTKALLESAKRLESAKHAADFGVGGIEPDRLVFDWATARNRSAAIVKKLTRGVDFLLKKNGVDVVSGEARFTDDHTVTAASRSFSAKHILIATGSIPAPPEYTVPPDRILEVRNLPDPVEIPRKLAVIGHQAYAVELAHLFRLCGHEVVLLAFHDRLIPPFDPVLATFLENRLKKDGVEIRKQPSISALDERGLHLENEIIPCEKIVHAPPRRAVIPETPFTLDRDNGFLRVDRDLRTSIPHIFAAGDVNGISELAHAASAQGLHVIDRIRELPPTDPVRLIPETLYTHPEIAQVGTTEPQLTEKGIDFKISEFSLHANGKALTEGESDGFIRVLFDPKYGEVLGVQIAAAHATDLIAEAALLMEMEGTVYDLARTIHAHPTVSEVFMESAWAAQDLPLHK